MKKLRKSYKWKFDYSIEEAIGFGIVVGHDRSKSRYNPSSWTFSVLIFCLVISLELSYTYKYK